MQWVLTAAGASVAVAVELIEALAIVLAVGAGRRWRDAFLGAAAAVAVCALVAAVLGPVILSRIPIDTLRVVIGVLLLLFGLEWLRKGTLRLAGRRARSSAQAEFDETREDLEHAPLPVSGGPDWAARVVAFKGVLLEGVEVVLIVSVLAERPSGPAPALVGAVVAVVLAVAAAVWLRRPLANLPETELKWGVGVLLTSFGTFFCAEGLHAHWPGGDAAILYLVAFLAVVSQIQAHLLARSSA
jgi:uncharacterized membrane protein